MARTAGSGHIEMVQLCKDCGTNNFNQAMAMAAGGGHIEIVKMLKEWGTDDLTEPWLKRPALATSNL